MNHLRTQSIRGKLIAIVAATCVIALLISCAAFVLNNMQLIRGSKARQLTASARLLASNSTAAVSFSQSEAAAELLQSLSAIRTIEYARLSDVDGEALASYSRDPNTNIDHAEVDMEFGSLFTNGFLDVMVPVKEDDELLGTLYLRSSMSDVRQQLTQNLWIAGTIMAVSLFVALIMTIRLQQVISRPILNLAETTQKITKEGNYSLRVKTESADEIGTLYSCFNGMLDEIERAQTSLQDARDELEVRVDERTYELSQANKKLKDEFEERERMNSHMIDLSHRAGKAEIATGVLHNVGNVLNSINVSANLVRETLQFSRLPSMKKVIQLLEGQEDLADFFANTERGQALPGYLGKLTDKLEEEHSSAADELETLTKHLDHVKTIVSMQQSYAGISGLQESATIHSLIDDAEVLIASSLAKHQVRVVREFDELPEVKVEKQKLLQVFVNLLQNAKDAMIESGNDHRELIIRVRCVDDDRLHIAFVDNGIGIEPEHLTKIFSHGFTTKKDGHGFGLHSCANAVSEMRGKLSVDSKGKGCGATFLIDLPFLPVEVSV